MKIKIILTIVSLFILSLVLVLNYNKKEEITFTVEIIKDDYKIEKEIFVQEGNTIYQELKNNFEIEVRDGFLYKIDFLEAYNNSEAYIAIYINDKYSSYGINNLNLESEDKLSFIYTSI